MSSGVAVDDSVTAAFDALVKLRRHRCAVFKLNDDSSSIIVERTLPPSGGGADARADWIALTKSLPRTDCRYVAYDFAYEHQGLSKNRVLFVLWSPEDAKVRAKMLYASSQESLVKKLNGVQRALQCTDDDEIEYAVVARALAAHTASY